jgi:acetyl-CoA synthetase (ADP-forming)
MQKDFTEKIRKKTSFLEHEVKELLREMGLPVPKGVFVPRGEHAPSLERMTLPVVAKVSSAKIASKSDVGGVRPGIETQEELTKALDELFRIKDSEGVLVEEMAPSGIEVIVGGTMDRQFGPVVMFGLGGIFVELFRDVVFGLAPMNEEAAFKLVKQIKGYRLLEGYRDRPPVDIGRLIRIIVRVSEMMATGAIEEIDLNPVALYPGGAMILDAKMKGTTGGSA